MPRKNLIIGILVALVTAGAFSLAHAQAPSIEAFQRQIQALLLQVQTLQTQVTELRAELGASRAATLPATSPTPAATFTRALSFGMSGEDVQRLQEFLARDPGVYPEGLITGYFGPLTERAVQRWQEAHAIEQTGRVGPLTLARLNEILATASTPSREAAMTAPMVAPTPTSSATSTVAPAVTATSTAVEFSTSSSSLSITSSTTSFTASSTPLACPPSLITLLGPGCLWKEKTWFDYYQVSYLPTPTSTAAKSCSIEYASGCTVRPATSTIGTAGIPSMMASTSPAPTITCSVSQYWNGSSCISIASSASASSSASSTANSTTRGTLSVVVTSPNGGEQWTKGNTYPITWSLNASSTSLSSVTVAIDVIPTQGGYSTHLATVGNSNSWNWTIPSNQVSGNYILRIVVGNSDATAYDDADAPLTITVSAAVAPDPASLVGYWKFDGTGANEIAGAPAAVAAGGATFKPSGGKFGGYAYIPSSADYVRIPYSSLYDLPNAFSVEFWFRQRSNQSFNQGLVYKGTPVNNYNFNVQRNLWNEYNSGAVIAGSTAANTGYWHQASNQNNLAHGEWHHIVYTRTTTDIAYYLDGALTYSSSLSSEYAGATKTPAVDILVGNPAPDTDIDNLKIYNRALTEGEVRYNYTAPTALENNASKQLADILTTLTALLKKLGRGVTR